MSYSPLSKHLPPSAGRPRVLALDAAAAALLNPKGADVNLVGPAQARFALPALPFRAEAFDALAARCPPPELDLAGLWSLLRPGGRLIFLAEAENRSRLLEGLAGAGYIHLFAEDASGGVLVRGERPPRAARPVERIAALAAASGQVEKARLIPFDARAADPGSVGRYLHLLILQTPNKPAWRLQPGEQVQWRAAVGVAPGGPLAAPAFTALVKAVAFMQAAVLAGALSGVNKVGKFPAAAARDWPFALIVNPAFAEWQGSPWAAGWRWQSVDARPAIRDE